MPNKCTSEKSTEGTSHTGIHSQYIHHSTVACFDTAVSAQIDSATGNEMCKTVRLTKHLTGGRNHYKIMFKKYNGAGDGSHDTLSSKSNDILS